MMNFKKGSQGDYPKFPGQGPQNKAPFAGRDFSYDKNNTGFTRQTEEYSQNFKIMGRENPPTQKAKKPGDLQK